MNKRKIIKKFVMLIFITIGSLAILSNLLLCFSCNNSFGELTPSNGLEYKSNPFGTEYYVTGIGRCTDEILVIPNKYKGLPVVKICENAFKECETITRLFTNSNLTTIETGAFMFCKNLEKVVISEGVKKISSSVFSGCEKLNDVRLADSI